MPSLLLVKRAIDVVWHKTKGAKTISMPWSSALRKNLGSIIAIIRIYEALTRSLSSHCLSCEYKQ